MLNELSISQAAAQLRSRQISARELTQACLDRIRKVDGVVKAFLSYDEPDALAQADAADQALAANPNDSRPLLGIPIGTVKWRVTEARKQLNARLER